MDISDLLAPDLLAPQTSYYFPPSSSNTSDLLAPQTNPYFPPSPDFSDLLAPQTNHYFPPSSSDLCTLSLNPFSPPVSHVMAPHSLSKIPPATDPRVSSKVTLLPSPSLTPIHFGDIIPTHPTPQEQGIFSWAARNPQKGIQPARIRPTLKQSDASKVNKDIQAKIRLDNAALLKAEINLIIATRDMLIEEAAKKFNVSVKKITKTVNAESNYKKTRKPTIFNALVSEKKEMNEGKSTSIMSEHALMTSAGYFLGLALGDRYKLRDLQDAAKLELDDLTDARKEQLLLRLEETRNLKQSGSRANTIAASQDARSTVVSFGVEVSTWPSYIPSHVHTANAILLQLEKLTARTGIQGVGLFVGGHMHDNFIGTILQCKGSGAFFKDVMGHSGADMLAKFEQWSWSKDTGVPLSWQQ
jgi:hypothetical protein